MKFKSLLCITAIFICLSLLHTYSQNMPNVIPPSPAAQQFHKYGDYPVSHFTGVPEIDIPIFNIKVDDLELPISLKYHASGIKVTDERGILGYGWTLIAGGMISRTTYGYPDQYAYLKPYGTLPADEISPKDDLDYLECFTIEEGTRHDGEYDIFSYGINSLNGKFVLHTGVEPNLLPYRPIILSYDTDFDYFNIKDEKGIQYRFGLSLDGNRFAYDRYPDEEQSRTSWLITDMVSSLNPLNTIKFYYTNDFYFVTTPNSHCYYPYDYDYWENGGDLQKKPATSFDAYCRYNSVSHSITVVNEITFKNGRVVFIYNNSSKLLEKIEVYNLVGKLKSYLFSYTSRWLLKNIGILDDDDNEIGQYTFEYFGEDVDFHKNTYAMDFWGYFNDKSNQSLLHNWDYCKLYYQQTEYDVGDADRSAVEGPMKLHTLRTIVYPTGGKTEFEFQSHKYKPGIEVAGGLRISKIINKDEYGNIVQTKEYKYSTTKYLEPDGLGYMAVQPRSGLYRHNLRMIYYTPENQEPYFNYCERVVYTSMPNYNLTPFGSSVVYPYITEYIGDATNNTGKIIYEYSLPDFLLNDGSTCEYTSKQYPYDLNLWDYGQLLSKEVFDINNNPIAFTQNSYYPKNIRSSLHGLIVYRYSLLSGIDWGDFVGSTGKDAGEYFFGLMGPFQGQGFIYYDYFLHTGESKLQKTTTLLDGVTTITEYKYDNNEHIQPTQILTQDSRGNILKTVNKYPAEVSSISGLTTDQINVINTMKNNQNRIATVIEQEQYIESQKVGANRTTYKDFGTENIYPDQVLVSKSDNPLEARMNYNNYDNFGNILDVSKENDIHTSYYWAYNKTYPVVKAENVTYETLYEKIVIAALHATMNWSNWITDPVSEKTKWEKFNNQLRQELPDAMLYTYTYKPLVGMTSETDPKGVTTYYEYDSYGRLSIVRDNDLNILKTFDYHYQTPTP